MNTLNSTAVASDGGAATSATVHIRHKDPWGHETWISGWGDEFAGCSDVWSTTIYRGSAKAFTPEEAAKIISELAADHRGNWEMVPVEERPHA